MVLVQQDCVLIKGDTWRRRHAQRKDDMKTQGPDGLSHPRREAWNTPSLMASRRNRPCPRLDRGRLASTTRRQYISVVCPTQSLVPAKSHRT